MTVRLVSWRDLTPELSGRLAQFSPYTSPRFVALFEAVNGQAGFLVVEESGEPISAIPLVEFGRGPLKRMQALPDGLPAPIWFAPGYIDRAGQLQNAILQAIVDRRYLKSRLTDYDNRWDTADWTLFPQVTSVIDFNPDLQSELWDPPDKTLRAEIAKSHREGVSVVKFNPMEQMSPFLELTSRTEERHGRRPKYPPLFWRALAELALTDDRIRWLCVQHESRLAAVHIFMKDKDSALNWQICFDKEFSSLKPNQAITWFAANQFRREGVRYLNLGATPADAPGVESYKQKWGGTDYRYRILSQRSFLGRLLW